MTRIFGYRFFDGPPYMHQSNEKVKNGRKCRKWGELSIQKVKRNISRNYHPFQTVRKMTRIFGYIEGKRAKTQVRHKKVQLHA